MALQPFVGPWPLFRFHNPKIKLFITTAVRTSNPIYLSISMALQPLLKLAAFSVSWSFYTVCRTPCTGDQPVVRPLPTHGATQTQNKDTDIPASSEIQTHDPSVRASEDSSCLRPRDHCDRLYTSLPQRNKVVVLGRTNRLLSFDTTRTA
jgi:hypothetical protein